MIVVDTSALVAILSLEPDASRYAAAVQAADVVKVSAITLLEAGIVMHSKQGPGGVDDLRDLLSSANVEIVPFDGDMARIGTDAFARFGRGSGSPAKLNFGDCASYALAKSLDIPLLFKGNDFSETDIVSAV